jgi:NhaA family Na+:H+ antiporter
MAVSPRKAGQISVDQRFSPAIRAVERPVYEFLQHQGIGAILLLAAAAVALVWANSNWASLYHDLTNSYLDLTVGPLKVHHSVLHWINDGLMTIFFFLVGMEIKHEVLHGYLSSAKKAALPALAAIGGMVAPAGIYALLNYGTPTLHGWGIPMATDIAFAVGVLSLVPSISHEMRVFLLALAIVDDIGAILVIAIFYSGGVNFAALMVAAGLLVFIIVAQWALPRFGPFQVVLGFLFWTAILSSGIHATIAGVILAFTVPSRSKFGLEKFEQEASAILQQLSDARREGNQQVADAALGALEALTVHTDSPMDRVTRSVLPWVTLVILPLFALANSGVTLTLQSVGESLRSPVFWGIAAGLLLGKPLGIALFTWLAVVVRIAELPPHATLRDVGGLGMVAGIGFTVAIFIANLAFSEAIDLDAAKIAILLASGTAAVLGFSFLRIFVRGQPPEPASHVS